MRESRAKAVSGEVLDAAPEEISQRVDLVFEVPGPEAPGFLRRQRRALQLGAALEEARESGAVTVDILEGMVAFLVDYITSPADRGAAREALWDASETQYKALLATIGGNAEVPLENSEV
jgi:hypothetical protein